MMLRVGGVAAGDADGEGGPAGGPSDAVGDGSVGDTPGVGATGDADGEGAARAALIVGAAGDANGAGIAGDAFLDGAAGDALTVRMLQVMDVGPRLGGGLGFWAWALVTPGGGCSGRCWSFGAPVLAVLVASGVGVATRHSSRRVMLVLLMVRVVDVMVVLMPMMLQVLHWVIPRVRALWVVMLRRSGGVAGNADSEGSVGDPPGDADAEDVAGGAFPAGDADGKGAAGDVTVYGVSGNDNGEGAAGAVSGVGPRLGGLWPVFGRGPLLFLAGGLVGGSDRWARQSFFLALVVLTVRVS